MAHALSMVPANVTAGILCSGSPFTATGATTYIWDNNFIDSITFNPTATATYTDNGKDIICRLWSLRIGISLVSTMRNMS
ncbi:MAG: hypothetical protein H0X62_11770 [Bacteroidetes bacterium]|nr:hypothetical protein [Bacteroidota bacterium]